jgi:hypothetical protein
MGRSYIASGPVFLVETGPFGLVDGSESDYEVATAAILGRHG